MFASLKLPLATAEAARRQHTASTFTEPLDVAPSRQAELKEFLADFYKTIYQKRNELSQLLQDNPTLASQYQTLVVTNKQVSYEDFFQRYFWKCDAQRILLEWQAKDQERAHARSEYIAGGLARVQQFVKDSTTTATTNDDANDISLSRETNDGCSTSPKQQDDAVDDFLKNPEIVKDGVDDFISGSSSLDEREEAVVFWNQEQESRTSKVPLEKPPRSPSSRKQKQQQQRSSSKDHVIDSKRNADPEESGEIPLVSKAASSPTQDAPVDKMNDTKPTLVVDQGHNKTSKGTMPVSTKETNQRHSTGSVTKEEWDDTKVSASPFAVGSIKPIDATRTVSSRRSAGVTIASTRTNIIAPESAGQVDTSVSETDAKGAIGHETTSIDSKHTEASSKTQEQVREVKAIPSSIIPEKGPIVEEKSVVAAASSVSSQATAAMLNNDAARASTNDAETKPRKTPPDKMESSSVKPLENEKPDVVVKKITTESSLRERRAGSNAKISNSNAQAATGKVPPPSKQANQMLHEKGNKVNRFKTYFENASNDAKKSNLSLSSPGEKPRAVPVLRSWKHNTETSAAPSRDIVASKSRDQKSDSTAPLKATETVDKTAETDKDRATKRGSAKRGGRAGRILQGWNKSKRDRNRKRKSGTSDDTDTDQLLIETTQSPRSVLYATSSEKIMSSADETKEATIDSPTTNEAKTLSGKPSMVWWQNRTLGIACLAVAIILTLSASTVFDGLCSPALPGTALTVGQNAYLEAPWWAPMPYKSHLFALVCGGDRARTAVEWVPFDKKKDSSRLTLLALVDGESSNAGRRERRRLSSAVLYSREVVVIDLQGKEVIIPAPWLVDTE